MRNQMKVMWKGIALTIGLVALILSLSACKASSNNLNNEPVIEEDNLTPIEQSVFEQNVKFLEQKGLKLPNLASNSMLTEETYLSLLVEAYESLGGPIDISKVNPNYDASEAVKKLTLLNVIDNRFLDEQSLSSHLYYGTAAYWLMELQDEIQRRLYERSNDNAIASDVLIRVNASNALHTWTTETTDDYEALTANELQDETVALDEQLTRLQIAEMLVKAYESTLGTELKVNDASALSDTDNIYALKAIDFFYWSNMGFFNPEVKESWEDRTFMGVYSYDSQLRLALNLEEATVPYGAVVSAFANMIDTYDNMQQSVADEKIVLNERPYEWYVTQLETGEFSDVNCMPATVSMALKYQGILDVPSVMQLRHDYPLDGQGWHDLTAENAMLQYGLTFTDSFEESIDLDKMLTQLDSGNVLYVMYREEHSEIGHSVIIKGYWKLGDKLSFIVNDPNDTNLGPFGYVDYLKDAQTMKLDIERHLTRYFIIPASQSM